MMRLFSTNRLDAGGGSVIVNADGTVSVVGDMDITGLATFSGGWKVDGGSIGPGRAYKSPSVGLLISGITGSASDFAIYTPGGNAVMTVPTGTDNVLFADSVEIDGDFNHDGTNVGFLGAAPQAQQAHIIDADGGLADITTKFNTLLADLEGFGFLAAA